MSEQDSQTTPSQSQDADFSERVDTSLQQSVVFDLIRLMNLIIRPFVENHAKTYDITLPEWRTMMVLVSSPGASGEDVARQLSTDRMSVSRALRRLEKAGRANRRKLPTDRKYNQWYLTEAGWTVFDAIASAARAHEASILAEFPAAEQKQLQDMVQRLMVRAEQIW